MRTRMSAGLRACMRARARGRGRARAGVREYVACACAPAHLHAHAVACVRACVRGCLLHDVRDRLVRGVADAREESARRPGELRATQRAERLRYSKVLSRRTQRFWYSEYSRAMMPRHSPPKMGRATNDGTRGYSEYSGAGGGSGGRAWIVAVVGGSTASARTHWTRAGQERCQWPTPAHCAHAYKGTTLAHTHTHTHAQSPTRTHARTHTHAGVARLEERHDRDLAGQLDQEALQPCRPLHCTHS